MTVMGGTQLEALTEPAVAPQEITVAESQIRLLKFLVLFGFGGTERQVVNLVRMLDRSRFSTQFGCLKRSGHFLKDIEQQQIPINEYRIRSLYMPGTLRQQLRLAQDMRRDRVQIFHSYNFYANVFAVPAARLAGVPVVIASIRDTGLGITPAKMHLHRLVCRFADCILVNAEAIRQWLIASGYQEEKIEVIRNGLDLARFSRIGDGKALRQEFGLPQNAPLVVVLARLVPSKGIEVFLEAAAEVSRRCPEARFLIVGDLYVSVRGQREAEPEMEYSGRLKQQAERLGLGGRIIFTGYRSDIPELLSQASVSVLPSLSGEGLPNAVMESMAVGVPVVATRVGGIPEIVGENGVAGLLVPPRDPGALTEAICAILENKELAQRLGAEAKRRITQHFSLERMVRATEELYLRLLKRSVRAPGGSSRI
ncbi:MAG TPA: glycosyltransferase [Gammaproteobacteria bacterium]